MKYSLISLLIMLKLPVILAKNENCANFIEKNEMKIVHLCDYGIEKPSKFDFSTQSLNAFEQYMILKYNQMLE